MTNSHDNDLALETLLQVAKEIAPELPAQLIESAYTVQRSHQFDVGSEREAALQALRGLLEDHIGKVGPAEASK